MKKMLFTLPALLGLAAAAHGQGLTPMPNDAVKMTAINDNSKGFVIVSAENAPNEVGWKLFDGLFSSASYRSKWLTQSSSGWVVWQFANDDRWAVTNYVLWTAEDVAGRDPSHWFLEGSNDLAGQTFADATNATWTVIDERNRNGIPLGDVFDDSMRNRTFSFSCDTNTKAYNAYRLNILSNCGANNLLQIAEWQMQGHSGVPDGDLLVTALPATSIGAESAVANGRLVQTGFAPDADVYAYWATNNTPGGPLDWDCAPKRLEGLEPGDVFFFELENLLPATEYQYRFLATNTATEAFAWSGAGTFATFPTVPVISTLSAAGVAHTHATARCDVHWPGISGITDLVVFYGVSNGGDFEGQWQAAATNVNVASAGTQSKTLADLLPNTTYWYRWRADSEWAPGSASFTTPPALVPQAVSGVASTNATLNCRVDYAGTSGAASVVLWFGTVNGGTTPSAWQASASATAGVGDHAQTVGGLLPSTVYHYRWQIDGAWYGGGTFTTFPSIELLAPTGVGWSAATLNCRVWYAGPSGVSDLVLYYGTADRGKDAKAWTEFAPVTIPGATPGEHAATLIGLEPVTSYYYRWFAAGGCSEAGVFSTVLWEAGGIGTTWYWTGEGEEPNVSDTNNWRLANAAGRHPDPIDEIFRCTLWFWGHNVPPVINQDIDPLVINQFRIGDSYGGNFNGVTDDIKFLYNDLSVTNKPIILLDCYYEVTWYGERGQPARHVRFYNDLLSTPRADSSATVTRSTSTARFRNSTGARCSPPAGGAIMPTSAGRSTSRAGSAPA